MHVQKWEIFYIIVSSTVALASFLSGFFPFSSYIERTTSILDEPPSFINDGKLPAVKLNTSSLYRPIVDKLVIIVIDSLRYDYFEDKILLNRIHMPFTSSSLRKDNKTCLIKAKASPPSVTMPRIKAITIGTTPTYFDVILNLQTPEVKQDNVLLKAHKHGLKLVFYGDETWLKMFPNYFIRSEGTKSFYVSDYTEVDTNVTRNVHKELLRSDWNIMILHYLGLDHIGHLEGPFSKLAPPKLKEMDIIVELIQTHLKEWEEKTGKSSLLLLTGDHGMKDTGGHGGASTAELTVPIVSFGLPCSSRKDDNVMQLDIAPTLSVLLGLPIPIDSSGRLILDLLRKLSPEQILYNLYYNGEILAQKFTRSGEGTPYADCFMPYEKAKKLHVKWLNFNKSTGDEFKNDSIALYEQSLQCMSTYLIKNSTHFDLPVMMFALGILIQVIVLLIFKPALKIVSALPIAIFTILCVIFLVILSKIFLCSNYPDSSLCISTLFSCLITLIIVVNTIQMKFIKFSLKKINFRNTFLNFLIFGTFLQIISVSSTSFIEEEHQVWYFMSPSFILLIMLTIKDANKNMLHLVLILCTFRFLRKLNSVGDKWISEIDIGDILRENKFYLALFTILGISFNYSSHVWIRKYTLKSKLPNKRYLFLVSALSIAHLAYQMTVNDFFSLSTSNHPSNTPIYLVWFYWFLLICAIAEDIRSIFSAKDRVTKVETWNETTRMILMTWIFFVGLLQKPHNIILIPAITFVCHYIHKTLFDLYEDNEIIMGIMHYWLGMLFYFYQGNTNSLASIDVAAGYIGLTDFDLFQVCCQILMNTSAFPVLSYLLLLNYLIRNSDCTQRFLKRIRKVNTILLVVQIVHLTFYLFVATFQRYHLFIWSVFSPKLLYLSYQSVLLFVIIVFSELFYFILQNLI